MKNILFLLLLAIPAVGFSQFKEDKDLMDPAADTVGKLVYQFVDQMPACTVNVGSFFGANLHYPDKARKKNVEGRVIIKFIVNEDGSISNLEATTHLGSGLEEEGIRVMKLMPKWKPGRQNGKPVKVYFTQPITFRLQ